MEEQQELEESGVSIKDIFKTIWLRRWFALAVAVALFLICAISLFYVYNPSKRYYEMKFSLNLPGTVSGATYIFPDGTQFYYTDYVSENTLETVKGTDEDFADINVSSMAKSGSISINRETSNDDTVGETVYTLRVKASYFENETQAKNFLTSLADAPMSYLRGMRIEYDVYLSIAENAIDYETEIGFLKSQLAVIQREYEQLITLYGGSFVGNSENGKTLLAYSQEVKAYSDSGVLDNLISVLRTEKYIKSEECGTYYQNMIETLTRDRDVKKAALEKIMRPDVSDGSVIINIDSSVLALAKEVSELDAQIDALKMYEGCTVKEGFVDEAFNTVSQLTETLATTCANVYGKASSVVYVYSGILNTTGGLGLTMIVLVSLVIAVIVALIAGYVAGKLKLKYATAGKNETENTVSKEEKPEEETDGNDIKE